MSAFGGKADISRPSQDQSGPRTMWNRATIIVHDGEDENKIIKDMEARGEIPPPGSLPAGQIRVIVLRIISPPNGEPNWERYHTESRQSH